MRHLNKTTLAATLLVAGIALVAQTPVPDIPFTSATNFLKFPDSIQLGEAAGVATNSRGDVFVYTRTGHSTITIGTSRPFVHGGSRLVQFDRLGNFVREIGKDSYGFLDAQQVRVDPQNNVWIVDQMSSMVIEFDTNARVQLLLGRKAESERVPAAPLTPATGGGRGGGLPGAGAQSDLFNRPTDVAWDGAGNIYVADGLGNARIAKFDKDGKFIRSWGSRGPANGQFSAVQGIAIDAKGNVYAADPGNKRIQVFDGDGNYKSQIVNIGAPAAICISPGAHQYLYSSNSNPINDIDANGEIYRLDLDGTVLGKFGKAGKAPKEFGTVNAIDCRGNTELYVGELGNWRVQKIELTAK
jgi:hypothetical protein